MLSKISYIWHDTCFSFESISTMKLASLRKIHDDHYRCLFHRCNQFRRHHHRHCHHRHYVIIVIVIVIIIVGIFVVVSVTSRTPNFALVKVKEHLLIRSHCKREASPIHWLPYIKSCHPRRAVDKNQKSPGNEVLIMPDSWHWYLGEPVLPKRKGTFGMGSSFQVRQGTRPTEAGAILDFVLTCEYER